MARVTTDDLLGALREYGKPIPKRPAGKGWLTADEMANAEGITIPALRYRLKLAIQNGLKIETAPGSALVDGVVKRATFYRVQK